jgi:hypothetical protein
MTKIAGSGFNRKRHGSPYPNPPQNVMDTQHWLANMRVLVYLSNCDDHAEELLRSIEQSSVLRRVSNLWKGELFKTDTFTDSVVEP